MVDGASGAELLVVVAAVGMVIIAELKLTMVTGSVLTLVVTVCDSAVVVDSAVAVILLIAAVALVTSQHQEPPK